MTADGCPKMATVLAVAKEVAEGMAFLHAHDVVHGDLTGGMLNGHICFHACQPLPDLSFQVPVSMQRLGPVTSIMGWCCWR